MAQAERGRPRARAQGLASGSGSRPIALGQLVQRAGDHPDAERRRRPAPALCASSCRASHSSTAASAGREGRPQAAQHARQIAALPGQHRAERHGDEQRHHQRHEGGVEEGRPDRDLGAADRVQDQRIERAQEHGGAGGRQQQVVRAQPALARDRREQAAALQRRRAPGVEQPASRRSRPRAGPG